MANHLSELLEKVESEDYWQSLSEEHWVEYGERLEKDTLSIGGKAMCFDCGDLESNMLLTSIPELVRLPFKDIWQQFSTVHDGREIVYGYLCSEIDDEQVDQFRFICWKREKRNHWVLCYAGVYLYECDSPIIIAKFSKHDDEVVQVYENHLSAITGFLSSLNCRNTCLKRHDPPTRLNKKRTKKGKKPLFSYWTLHLSWNSDDQKGGELRGGDRSSPRVHLRRGHARQYRPGQYTWVQPCMVRGATPGIVHKDYQLDQPNG